MARDDGKPGPDLRVLRGGRADDPPVPKLFECRLCGKLFDAWGDLPTCPECDSDDCERMG